MKQVPYYGNPGNACALACYTMVAQYLLPNKKVTFEQLSKIADWKEGYVVWGFQVWEWLMNQGIHIVDYDTIDYQAWAKNGLAGLQTSASPQEFTFYKDNTFDVESESEYISQMFEHPNFTYVRKKPTWEDVVREFRAPGICDLTLNSAALNKQEGFYPHRVVLLDITDTHVVFHDPNRGWDGEKRRETLKHFRQTFDSLNDPELARYWIED
ncbi:MAG TPA: hypothetical protein VLG37_03100 [Candidatus Saccharimonadales bacterium]|nr:hypothetical protein [Candidatus Saccharimonadales bacterium]